MHLLLSGYSAMLKSMRTCQGPTAAPFVLPDAHCMSIQCDSTSLVLAAPLMLSGQQARAPLDLLAGLVLHLNVLCTNSSSTVSNSSRCVCLVMLLCLWWLASKGSISSMLCVLV